jgi:hypothetical protein
MKKGIGILVLSLLWCNTSFAECIDDDCEKKSEIETPTGLDYITPGFDFVCYNSCKERNDESFCQKQCTLALE